MITVEDLPNPKYQDQGLRREAGRSLAQKLGAIRSEIAEGGAAAEVIGMFDRAIFEIVHWSKYTDAELDSIMLDMIEDGLNFATDISEELGLDRRIIVESLNRLEARGRIYKVKRLVVGSGRPQYMYKSQRVQNIEIDTTPFHVPGNWPIPEDTAAI